MRAAPLAPLAGTLDAIAANLPYIPTGDLDRLAPEVRDHEPRIALDGGPDGLAVISRLVAQAPRALRIGGWLLLEVGDGQAPAVRALVQGAGAYGPCETLCDLAGVERVVAAQRRA